MKMYQMKKFQGAEIIQNSSPKLEFKSNDSPTIYIAFIPTNQCIPFI
jgi:hypothetical protein